MTEIGKTLKSWDTVIFEVFKAYCIVVTLWVFYTILHSLNSIKVDAQNASPENIADIVNRDWYDLVLPEALVCGILIIICLLLLITFSLKYKKLHKELALISANWTILGLVLAFSYTIGANIAQFIILNNFY